MILWCTVRIILTKVKYLIRQLPKRPSIFERLASSMFLQHGAWGWSTKTGNLGWPLLRPGRAITSGPPSHSTWDDWAEQGWKQVSLTVKQSVIQQKTRQQVSSEVSLGNLNDSAGTARTGYRCNSNMPQVGSGCPQMYVYAWVHGCHLLWGWLGQLRLIDACRPLTKGICPHCNTKFWSSDGDWSFTEITIASGWWRIVTQSHRSGWYIQL